MDKFYPWLKLDALNSFVVLGIAFFSILTVIYSLKFIKKGRQSIQYYAYLAVTSLVSILAVLANNLILLAICWGFLGLLLYLMINLSEEDASAVAKKTFIIIGGTDALMLLGIGIIYFLTKTLQMDQISIPLAGSSALVIFAYLTIVAACFAKAGAMPFHTWIPDCAEAAPLPVVAFLPASLDKLLGIYLFARVTLDLFIMVPAMNSVLMLIGAFTIIAAVMMALVQHNMKRLLAYSTVSQVGYMVLGIASGVPIAIAGGIFHMLNHTVYKAGLFFTAGNVEYRMKTTELNKLGGLARFMPFTYVSALVASLSISGVPPFNGFVSKWMVYQGLIAKFQQASFSLRMISALCLIAAMFGSGLTLAASLKLLHATYLGQRPAGQRISEVSWTMWLPCIILAITCIIFGIFAEQLPLRYFIYPAAGSVSSIGVWQSGLSTFLIFVGLLLGIIVFAAANLKSSFRRDAAFTGAETTSIEEHRVTGTEFYNTVREFGILNTIYKKALKGAFDIYEQGKFLVFAIGRFLQYLHNGVLPTYLVWSLLGMIVLFIILVK